MKSSFLSPGVRKKFLVLVAALLLGSSFFIWGDRNDQKNRSAAACRPSAEDRYGEFKCFEGKAHEIASLFGIKEAIEFVDQEMREKSIFGYTHMVMHSVGHDAYHMTEDLKTALSYLPTLRGISPELYEIRFSGYRHGVMGAFLTEEKDKKPIRELMHLACENYFNITADPPEKLGHGFDNCFHGIGHALMIAYENDVLQSLAACDELPERRMRDWCYYGTFMENSYLYSKAYASEKPKPSAQGESMASLCLAVSEKYRRHCTLLMGGAHLAAQRGDLEGMVSDCETLEEQYRRECVTNAARLYITSQFKNNFPEMLKTCKELAAPYEESCLYAVSVGIASEGYAYSEKNRQTFCNLVEEKFREKCLNASRVWRLF